MSAEIPQFHQLSEHEANHRLNKLDIIGDVYQKYLVNIPIYVTGSVALHRIIAPRENWNFPDMDMLIPGTSKQNLEARIDKTRAACNELGGTFQSIHYALREEGEINMRDVLVKGICRLPDKSVVPQISTIFSNESLETYLKNAKPPSVIAYEAKNPNKFIVGNHRWLKHLRERYILPMSLSGVSAKAQNLLYLKYGPRGFLMNSGSKPVTLDKNTDNTDMLLKNINEQQWRSMVTSKIHYRAGSAWRNLRIGEGFAVGSVGIFMACRGPYHPYLRFPIAILSLTLAAAITEQPSKRADEHQRAGARYGGLEREWALLRTKLLEKRIRYDWADSQTMYLQRKKEIIDMKSPNAPEYWKKGVISELSHKHNNLDP